MANKGVYAAIPILLIAVAVIGLNSLNNHQTTEEDNQNVTVVAEDLDVLWDIEFLPNGDMLVTERPGTLLRINNYTDSRIEVDGVEHRGEGGLLGMALHPEFEENRQIYLYMTTEKDGMLENRVVRYNLEENSLSDPETIIDGLPGAPYHDGGRIAFGPDGKLFITAGDATNPEWAQNTERLAGKILRVNPDGSIPEDNPFNNSVYSYGHRNPQGLTWVGDQLWATEHGDRNKDELNKIQRGGNYGWPVIEGSEEQEGLESPELHSGSTTWAPAGAEYIDGSIYFTGLRGNALYKVEIEDGEATNISEHLTDYGRLREVEERDGVLYVSTSNTDGRGTPGSDDDRILKVNPENLE